MFVKKMLGLGWLDCADLENAVFGGGPVVGERRSREAGDLRVVDNEGRGLDAAVFYDSVIATGGLDFDDLSQRCGIQMASDVTAEHLAGFIDAGRVTVRDLIGALRLAAGKPYEDALLELAKRKAQGGLSQRDIDAESTRLRQQFTVKQKAIETDLSTAEKQVKDRLAKIGLLESKETALIPRHRDYADHIAIVQTGGQTMVYDTKQPKLSQALMTQDSFEFAHRNEWFEVDDANGGKQTIYPAREFLKKPPRNARVYRGGFVFRPSGTVRSDQCNLYRGFDIQPDASGSCDLVYELMSSVWTFRLPEVFEWVREWVWHIFAHPGESVGTALALRGEPGHGKSIFFDQCLPKLLSDMQLRVTNQNLVSGNFNEAIAGRLLITLEEAAFAGDKKTFDSLKELITGKQVVINAKFKAPITLDNYARVAIISNHEHFLLSTPE